VNIWDDPGYQDWETRVKDRVVPMLQDTAVTVSLLPSGEIDIKFAVELGLSIMMDKPIIALVRPGMHIPDGLARVAAEIVEVDIAGDIDAAQRSITEAIGRILHTDGHHVSLEDIDDDED
jgi:hypothetical protein